MTCFLPPVPVQAEMHTGEPLFGGADSHDQIFKIVQMVGPIPDALVRRAEKREKYFERHGKELFSLKTPPQYRSKEEGGCLELPPERTLRGILGVDSGGPAGRRAGEKGHSPVHYEAFNDILAKMLTTDPAQRITPTEALKHRFLDGDLWPRPPRREEGGRDGKSGHRRHEGGSSKGIP